MLDWASDPRCKEGFGGMGAESGTTMAAGRGQCLESLLRTDSGDLEK